MRCTDCALGDVHKAAATAKANLPVGRDPNATGYAAEAGGKIDKAVSDFPNLH